MDSSGLPCCLRSTNVLHKRLDFEFKQLARSINKRLHDHTYPKPDKSLITAQLPEDVSSAYRMAFTRTILICLSSSASTSFRAIFANSQALSRPFVPPPTPNRTHISFTLSIQLAAAPDSALMATLPTTVGALQSLGTSKAVYDEGRNEEMVVDAGKSER
ncbi:hypothetical protein Moror_11163 [Moniliophthora roreri MCA 2997]|uniref:Uncharacterized protein n=2 Tax=Moniliophthora roreri TaxID=221103 RepID=V2WQ98_MONRO|nr:hypothetical protein Moror_11163 [Moniliophthora roreri MCA 2997]KAI3596389.1 hypothetical protein WG66_003084 [Moniliophthora roreri]